MNPERGRSERHPFENRNAALQPATHSSRAGLDNWVHGHLRERKASSSWAPSALRWVNAVCDIQLRGKFGRSTHRDA
jgi:hypothetical protein